MLAKIVIMVTVINSDSPDRPAWQIICDCYFTEFYIEGSGFLGSFSEDVDPKVKCLIHVVTPSRSINENSWVEPLWAGIPSSGRSNTLWDALCYGNLNYIEPDKSPATARLLTNYKLKAVSLRMKTWLCKCVINTMITFAKAWLETIMLPFFNVPLLTRTVAIELKEKTPYLQQDSGQKWPDEVSSHHKTVLTLSLCLFVTPRQSLPQDSFCWPWDRAALQELWLPLRVHQNWFPLKYTRKYVSNEKNLLNY